jgi:translation initiation factor IF-2
VQACLLEYFQDLVDMFLVFFKSVRVNEDIIEVCSAKSVEIGSENIIDEILEGCWGIGETK